MKVPELDLDAYRQLSFDIDVEDLRLVEVVGHAEPTLSSDGSALARDPTIKGTFLKFGKVATVDSMKRGIRRG